MFHICESQTLKNDHTLVILIFVEASHTDMEVQIRVAPKRALRQNSALALIRLPSINKLIIITCLGGRVV